jgi:hypothetical protein
MPRPRAGSQPCPTSSRRRCRDVHGGGERQLAAAIAFLGLSDLWLEAGEDELVGLVVGVAEGKVGKAEVSVFIQQQAEAAGDP